MLLKRLIFGDYTKIRTTRFPYVNDNTFIFQEYDLLHAYFGNPCDVQKRKEVS